jgi:ABC-type transport system involved in multi-copper enzyme maturation permease subunit
MEWYFQRRSASFWVMVTLIGALGAFLVARARQLAGGDTPFQVASYYSLSWIQMLLLPVLVVALLWRTMHRDRQGAGALVFTRPVGAGAWVLGKTLGALFAVTVLYLAAYTVTYAVLSVQQGEMLPPASNLLALLLYWLNPIAVDVVLYLLLGAVVATPLLTAIPYLVTCTGLYVLPSFLVGHLSQVCSATLEFAYIPLSR